MQPLAYLLTFCCYATWLPGDPRSYTDRHHNGLGLPRAEPSRGLRATMARRLPQPPYLLDAPARAAVEAAIREHCAHVGWPLHAVHVRTNHLHVVLSGADPPQRMMNALKAWSTRRLRAEGLIGDDVKPWSRHGSVRGLWAARAVEAACRYVVEGQGAALPAP
jgi:REP element-mobilizing transposase RayT